jgi:hypothetical protein
MSIAPIIAFDILVTAYLVLHLDRSTPLRTLNACCSPFDYAQGMLSLDHLLQLLYHKVNLFFGVLLAE